MKEVRGNNNIHTTHEIMALFCHHKLMTSLIDNFIFILTISLFPEGRWALLRVPQSQQALCREEVTVHNTGTSLLIHVPTSAWVLLSPPIARQETRPTA